MRARSAAPARARDPGALRDARSRHPCCAAIVDASRAPARTPRTAPVVEHARRACRCRATPARLRARRDAAAQHHDAHLAAARVERHRFARPQAVRGEADVLPARRLRRHRRRSSRRSRCALTSRSWPPCSARRCLRSVSKPFSGIARSSARRPDPARPRPRASPRSRASRRTRMQRGKSTAPSPGTVKAPLITASRKLQLPLRASLMHVRPHVLAVHVADALDVLAQHRRPASPPANVMWPVSNSRPTSSAVTRHQRVDVGGRLDVRAHVMVVGERARRATACARANCVSRSAYASHCAVVKKRGRLYSGCGAPWMLSGDLAVDHDLGAVVGEQLAGAGRPRRSRPRRVRSASRPEYQPDTSARPCAASTVAQRLRFARKLVAELEALVADLLAFGRARPRAASRRRARAGRRCSTRSD